MKLVGAKKLAPQRMIINQVRLTFGPTIINSNNNLLVNTMTPKLIIFDSNYSNFFFLITRKNRYAPSRTPLKNV